MRWRREGGYKREGGREKRACRVLLDFGVGYDFRIVVIFGDLRNLWRFLGLVERREILFILVWIIHFGHTTSCWTWARRAREPVEVSWARNYFLVGW